MLVRYNVPPVVAPLTKKVDEMFDFFQANNARAAAVLNEFGGVEGFVTMRDVLNFIFGHTSGLVEGQSLYRERDENVYEVAGDMKLTDFNNLTNFGIEDPRMTTIGGVAFRHLDRLPHEGDRVIVEGIRITVLEMKEHRISRVRVARGQADEETPVATDTPRDDAEADNSPAPATEDETRPDKGQDTEDETMFIATEDTTPLEPEESAQAAQAPEPTDSQTAPNR